jgi:hypothetical protein
MHSVLIIKFARDGDMNLIENHIYKKITSFLGYRKSDSMVYGDCFVRCCILFNIIYYIKVFHFSFAQYANIDWFMGIVACILCIALCIYDYVFFVANKMAIQIVLTYVPLLLISLVSWFLMKASLFGVFGGAIFFMSILTFYISNKMKDENLAKRLLHITYFIIIILFICVGQALKFPETEKYVSILLKRGLIAFFFIISMIKGFEKNRRNGINANIYVLYTCAFINGFLNLALTPIYFAWFGLPGFANANFFLASIQFACMFASTPMFFGMIKSVEETRAC